MNPAQRILGAMMLIYASVSWSFCDEFPAIEKEYTESELVFVAKVVREELVPDSKPTFFSGTLYYLQQERQLKGSVVHDLRLFSVNTTSRFPIEVGVSYLIFANSENDLYKDSHTYWINSCGNSKPLSEAKDDLKLLGKFK